LPHFYVAAARLTIVSHASPGIYVPKGEAYNVTMYIMATLLLIGFCCNLAMHPVHEKHHHKEAA
jgi:hypothetical protein